MNLEFLKQQIREQRDIVSTDKATIQKEYGFSKAYYETSGYVQALDWVLKQLGEKVR